MDDPIVSATVMPGGRGRDSAGCLSQVLGGRKPPTEALARALDVVLGTARTPVRPAARRTGGPS